MRKGVKDDFTKSEFKQNNLLCINKSGKNLTCMYYITCKLLKLRLILFNMAINGVLFLPYNNESCIIFMLPNKL